MRALLRYIAWKHLQIKHSPDPLYEQTYIEDFSTPEDTGKLNNLDRFRITIPCLAIGLFTSASHCSEYIELDYTGENSYKGD